MSLPPWFAPPPTPHPPGLATAFAPCRVVVCSCVYLFACSKLQNFQISPANFPGKIQFLTNDINWASSSPSHPHPHPPPFSRASEPARNQKPKHRELARLNEKQTLLVTLVSPSRNACIRLKCAPFAYLRRGVGGGRISTALMRIKKRLNYQRRCLAVAYRTSNTWWLSDNIFAVVWQTLNCEKSNTAFGAALFSTTE